VAAGPHRRAVLFAPTYLSLFRRRNTSLNSCSNSHHDGGAPGFQPALVAEMAGEQLKTAKGWESDQTTARAHEQFGYAYDAAWNLNRRTNNALVQTFNVNSFHPMR
jgi:hypothetical protein